MPSIARVGVLALFLAACSGSGDDEESQFPAKSDDAVESLFGSCSADGAFSQGLLCEQPCSSEPYRARCSEGRWDCSNVKPACQPPSEPADSGVN